MIIWRGGNPGPLKTEPEVHREVRTHERPICATDKNLHVPNGFNAFLSIDRQFSAFSYGFQ